MGNTGFKNLSGSELLKMTSHQNFGELVRREPHQAMGVSLRGTTANSSRKEISKENKFIIFLCSNYSRAIINCSELVLGHDDAFLRKISSERNSSIYIHANYVDGFEAIDKYICTRTSIENTWKPFIKLIWDRSSRVVVSLMDLNEND